MASSSPPQLLVMILIIALSTILLVARLSSETPTDAVVAADDECVCTSHRNDIKILNLGLPKSGTGTLNRLLMKMGCHSLHFDAFKKDLNLTRLFNASNYSSLPYRTHPEMDHLRVEQLLDFENASFHSFVGPMMELALTNNESLLYYLSNTVRAVSQMDYCLKLNEGPCVWPQLIHYQLLNAQYPNALFVLMRRNVSSHIESISNWLNMRQRIVLHDVPYLPKGKGQSDEEIARWIHAHYARVIQFFNQTQNRRQRFIQFDIGHDSVEKLTKFFHCAGNYELDHIHKTKKNL